MRGIIRAIVAVMLVVGAVPALGAAQAIDHTDADPASSGFVTDAGPADGHANQDDDPADDPDGERAGTDGGANESEATGFAGGDVGGDGSAFDGSTSRAAGDAGDGPAPVSDDWWDRVRCLRPLPVDPAPPIEPIPCEDDGELVLLRTTDDGGISAGFPTQGGVIRVQQPDTGSGEDVDLPVRKKPGRTTYADITLERGYVMPPDDGSSDGVGPARERSGLWIAVLVSADGGRDDATERPGAGEAAAPVVGPGDARCPIQWPTGPFDPTGPTTRPCPVTVDVAADTGGVADAVSPSSSHGVAGAVSPSDSHGVAGAVTPSDNHVQVILEKIKHLDKASPKLYQR